MEKKLANENTFSFQLLMDSLLPHQNGKDSGPRDAEVQQKQYEMAYQTGMKIEEPKKASFSPTLGLGKKNSIQPYNISDKKTLKIDPPQKEIEKQNKSKLLQQQKHQQHQQHQQQHSLLNASQKQELSITTPTNEKEAKPIDLSNNALINEEGVVIETSDEKLVSLLASTSPTSPSMSPLTSTTQSKSSISKSSSLPLEMHQTEEEEKMFLQNVMGTNLEEVSEANEEVPKQSGTKSEVDRIQKLYDIEVKIKISAEKMMSLYPHGSFEHFRASEQVKQCADTMASYTDRLAEIASDRLNGNRNLSLDFDHEEEDFGVSKFKAAAIRKTIAKTEKLAKATNTRKCATLNLKKLQWEMILNSSDSNKLKTEKFDIYLYADITSNGTTWSSEEVEITHLTKVVNFNRACELPLFKDRMPIVSLHMKTTRRANSRMAGPKSVFKSLSFNAGSTSARSNREANQRPPSVMTMSKILGTGVLNVSALQESLAPVRCYLSDTQSHIISPSFTVLASMTPEKKVDVDYIEGIINIQQTTAAIVTWNLRYALIHGNSMFLWNSDTDRLFDNKKPTEIQLSTKEQKGRINHAKDCTRENTLILNTPTDEYYIAVESENCLQNWLDAFQKSFDDL